MSGNKTRWPIDMPPVGVLAKTEVIAISLIREMRLKNAKPLGIKCNPQGINLSTLMVDESCWPLTLAQQDTFLPCLAKEMGYVLRIIRYDPKKNRVSE